MAVALTLASPVPAEPRQRGQGRARSQSRADPVSPLMCEPELPCSSAPCQIFMAKSSFLSHRNPTPAGGFPGLSAAQSRAVLAGSAGRGSAHPRVPQNLPVSSPGHLLWVSLPRRRPVHPLPLFPGVCFAPGVPSTRDRRAPFPAPGRSRFLRAAPRSTETSPSSDTVPHNPLHNRH